MKRKLKSGEALASGQLRPSQQARSQATVDRLVKETMALLQNRDFDTISVDEIMENARTSKGSFYFRFESKSHLLRHIAEIYYGRWLNESRLFFESEENSALSLSRFLSRFVDHTANFYSENRNLIRALLKEARPGGDEIVIALVTSGSNQTLHMLISSLNSRRKEIKHPRPDYAIRITALMIGTLMRETFLFSEHRLQALSITPEIVKSEIMRMANRYLKLRDS
ncbi:TetR/AcrR family transcriptional regulator [bacterium]|nr:TetR/AcrR family transcriptional regulator [bacterium]MCI0606130.1 TetR/AcrR family transcriptional regulator [bacterium]